MTYIGQVLDDYRIWILFADGFKSTVQLKPFLKKGIAVELLDITAFAKVSIESGGGLAWRQNGFDICPKAFREFAEAKVHMA